MINDELDLDKPYFTEVRPKSVANNQRNLIDARRFTQQTFDDPSQNNDLKIISLTKSDMNRQLNLQFSAY